MSTARTARRFAPSLVLAALVACATKSPPPRPVAPPAKAAEPAWPVRVRFMTWTPDGLVQFGTSDVPPPPPPTPWFVEPFEALDPTAFSRLVIALQRDRIPGLSLRGQRVDWSELADLPHLTALVLDDTDVDAGALAAMKVSLKRLYLARTRVDDAAMAAIAAGHPLEVIDIEDTIVGDAGLEALSTIATLKAINASGTRITDAGGEKLGALASLEVVDLGRTLAGVKTVTALAPRALHQLFLDRTHAGRAVGKLAGMAPRIERIDLSSLVGYRPVDKDVAWLAQAPNLVEVGLSRARVSDRLVVELAKLPRLEQIRLAGTPITDAAIEKLAARTQLEEVDLAETAISDASAAALIALPALRVLRLDQTAVTDAGLAAPGAALVELYLSRTKVTDAGLAILDRTPKLEALGLGHTATGDPTLARLAKLASLHTLVLSGTKASREALAALRSLRELERLYLDETRADAEIVGVLARSIRILHLSNTDVAPEALAALAEMSKLQELAIGDTRMTARLVDVVTSWRRLHTLSLVGLAIADAHLPALARARSLARVDLSATDVTDPAPLASLVELRELGLSQTRLSAAGKTSANALARRGVRVVR